MPNDGGYRYGSNLDIVWQEDPRLLGIRLSRHKFVAKMFSGFSRVIAIGAGDGHLSQYIREEVVTLYLTDAHPESAGIAVWSPVRGGPPVADPFDGAYALDVLEHVAPADEDAFLSNIARALKPDGALIIGSPSLESQAWASRKSAESHINCKTEDQLGDLLRAHFRRVFMFGMNDEVVHTGFGPMCHYRLALAVARR